MKKCEKISFLLLCLLTFVSGCVFGECDWECIALEFEAYQQGGSNGTFAVEGSIEYDVVELGGFEFLVFYPEGRLDEKDYCDETSMMERYRKYEKYFREHSLEDVVVETSGVRLEEIEGTEADVRRASEAWFNVSPECIAKVRAFNRALQVYDSEVRAFTRWIEGCEHLFESGQEPIWYVYDVAYYGSPELLIGEFDRERVVLVKRAAERFLDRRVHHVDPKAGYECRGSPVAYMATMKRVFELFRSRLIEALDREARYQKGLRSGRERREQAI